MATQASLDFVQQLYVSYYGRPAESGGLQYWADRADAEGQSAIVNAFGDSQEYQDVFGSLTDQQLVNNLYQQMFNRDAEQAGLDFYTNMLSSGQSTLAEIALDIQNGAQGSDKEAFAAKVQAASTYTENNGAEGSYNVDDAKAVVDAAGAAGETFTLTAGDDQFFGTEMNDTFTADAGTLGANDQLLDQSTTDNDTLNAVITNANKTAGAATLLNIENVNLDLDVFTGAAFDADSTTGATITGSSSKLGFNGEFEVKHAGDNNVVAGENVTDLTVTGLEAGNVDAGAAETVDVTVSAGDTANVTANGDVALDVSGATDLNLTATADAAIDLTENSSVNTIVGDGEGVITLNAEATAASADEISGVDTIALDSLASGSGAISIDASNWDVNTIDVAVDLDYSGSGSTLEVAGGANVELSKAQSGMTVSGAEATNTATVASALASVGTLSFSNLAAAELNLSASDASVTSLTGSSVALDVNVEDGATIDALSGSNLTLAGAGDVTVTNGDSATVLDASALDGALDLTSAASGGQEIAGGQGDNVIEFTSASGDKTYSGQAGDDEVTFSGGTSGTVGVSFAGGDNTVDLGKVDTNGEVSVVGADGADTLKLSDDSVGTVAANLGAGDDVVEVSVGSGSASGDLTLAFGEGNDTLKMAAGADLSDASSVEITGLEAIEIGGSGNASFAADQLNGQELSVSSEDGGATLEVKGGSVDLSGISLNNTVGSNATASITGSSNADTIVGTQGDDTITGSGGADNLTGGEGDDTFQFASTFASGSGSDTDDEDTIQDFSAGDVIEFTNGSAVTLTISDVSTASGSVDNGIAVFYDSDADVTTLTVDLDTSGSSSTTADLQINLVGQFSADDFTYASGDLALA